MNQSYLLQNKLSWENFMINELLHKKQNKNKEKKCQKFFLLQNSY